VQDTPSRDRSDFLLRRSLNVQSFYSFLNLARAGGRRSATSRTSFQFALIEYSVRLSTT